MVASTKEGWRMEGEGEGASLQTALTFYPVAWKSQQQAPSKTNLVTVPFSVSFQQDLPLSFLKI